MHAHVWVYMYLVLTIMFICHFCSTSDFCTTISGKNLKVLEMESSLLHPTLTCPCLDGIIKLLSSGLEQLTLQIFNISSSELNELIATITPSKLKRLNFNCFYNIENAKSLAKLLTQTVTLDEVTVGQCSQMLLYRHQFDCSAARILIDAMAHSSVKILHLKVPHYKKIKCQILKDISRVSVHYCRRRKKS